MHSLFAKLTFIQAVCAIGVVAALYALMDKPLSRRMSEEFVSHGQVVAEALAQSAEPALAGVSHLVKENAANSR